MRKPNMMEAKKRTRAEIKVIRDAYIVPSSINNIGIDKKYFLRTYGCQMNVHDSENIKGELEELGYTEIDNYEDADLIIINTCAIRENAHNKVFGFLGRLKHLKKQKPNILVGLCGCMAQEEAVVNEIIDKYQWLDFVFGTHNIHELPQILKQHLDLKQLIVEVPSNEGNIYENIPVKRDHPFKAWVNIMYGCDKFCTYCIVPYTRGKQRSRRPEDIINEVKDLIKKGYLEVTLLGQNVNAYGKDFTGLDYNMATLLKDISKLPIKRIRFLTSHPWDFTKEMILVIKNNSNIMPHFHLPIQAGSNKVLKLMGRRYTKESYLELYQKIKQAIPGASITTDIIVGFPNETEVDFKETLDIVNKCKFDSAFTFIYSPREGTGAARIVDIVDIKEKEARLQTLNQLINKYTLESNQKLMNKMVPVLIEGKSARNEALLVGYTDTFKLVNIKGDSSLIGKIVDVKITEVKTWCLYGEVNNGKN